MGANFSHLMRSIVLLLVLLPMGVFAQPDNMDIRVKVDGFSGGTVRLIGVLGTQNYLVDTVAAEGPTFAFQRDGVAGGLYYMVFPGNKFIQLLLDEDQEFSFETSLTAPVRDMEIEGSEDNRLFYENLRFETSFQNRFTANSNALKAEKEDSPKYRKLKKASDELLEERKAHLDNFRKNHPGSFFTTFKLAGQNPELTYPQKPDGSTDTLRQLNEYRRNFWNDVDFNDERLVRTPVLANKLKTYITQLTPQVPDSVIKYADALVKKTLTAKETFKFMVNWIAIQYQKPKIMGGEAVYVHLVENFFTKELAFWADDTELYRIRKNALDMKMSLVGKVGQDITCENLNGEKESLYSLEAPLLLVYMYSYDCSHCREHTPEIVELFKEWKSKGVDIYALNIDKDREKWKEFVNRYEMHDFHNVIDPDYESGYYKKYHLDITPECYILNDKRVIVAKDLKPFQLPAVFERELKKMGK